MAPIGIGRIDVDWFREQLLSELLPRWLRRAPTRGGLFLSHFDRSWSPTGETHGTLVSQGRLLHNFAVGYDLTGDTAYLDAIGLGAPFLLDAFHDDEQGGWFYAVDEDGRVVDDHKDAYGHAFVLFGLAHAARVTTDPHYASAAVEARDVLLERLRDPAGGLVSRLTRDFTPLDSRRSQNPVMHFFEALLALSDVPGLRHVAGDAQTVAEFLFPHLLREDGALPELFTIDWRELPTAEGGWINIGHQFEWAFLLSAAVERGLPESYLSVAHRLLDWGMAAGYDPERGGIYTKALSGGTVDRSRKAWWEQCECIRALLRFATSHGRGDLWEPLERTQAFVRAHFIDREHGGWFASVSPEGKPRGTSKGSPFKLDYHQAGMCVEALRLARAHTP